GAAILLRGGQRGHAGGRCPARDRRGAGSRPVPGVRRALAIGASVRTMRVRRVGPGVAERRGAADQGTGGRLRCAPLAAAAKRNTGSNTPANPNTSTNTGTNTSTNAGTSTSTTPGTTPSTSTST